MLEEKIEPKMVQEGAEEPRQVSLVDPIIPEKAEEQESRQLQQDIIPKRTEEQESRQQEIIPEKAEEQESRQLQKDIIPKRTEEQESRQQETILEKTEEKESRQLQKEIILGKTEEQVSRKQYESMVDEYEYVSGPQQIPMSQDLKAKIEEIGCSSNYAHYNSYTAEDGNQIWAGALTLAWKELLQKYLKNEHLAISGDNKEIATNFNECSFNKSFIDEQSIYIKSGFGQQTVVQINDGMAKKFPECSFSPLAVHLNDKDLIAYAYLFKKLIFDVEFERHQYKRLTFTGKNTEQKQVDSFFVDNAKQAAQVQIHKWVSDQDFIVSLKNSSPSDKIFLYKPPKESKLGVGEVIRQIVITEITNENVKLQEFRNEIDKFEMPILDLNYTHSYKELIGASIVNDCTLKGYNFSQVAEGLKLKIDEKGVRCQNYGFMIVNECAISGPNPKKLHFDRPFWIIMKENLKHPYLCIQINNI